MLLKWKNVIDGMFHKQHNQLAGRQAPTKDEQVDGKANG